MATATMRAGSDTEPSSTGYLRAICSAAPGARDVRRDTLVLARHARRSRALPGSPRDRRAPAQEHAVRHAVRRAAHESGALSAVRLSERPDRNRTVPFDLPSAQVP